MKKAKIDWIELFKDLNLDYLFKDEHQMDTSPCCFYMGRDNTIKELNKRLNKQLKTFYFKLQEKLR